MDKAISRTRPERTGGAGEVGDRVKSLRIAAGLTQTELAGGRFSKEYVSQIERGKTRPTAETLEWLAERLDVEPAYLLGGVSAEERGRIEAALARAEALSERQRLSRCRDRVRRRPRCRRGHGRAGSRVPFAPRRDVGALPVGPGQGRAASARARPRHRRGAGVFRRRPRGRPVPTRRLPLHAVEHLDVGLAADLGGGARGSLRVCRATCSASTSSTGAPAATGASATGRRRARTSSARWSSPSPPATGGPRPQAFFQASLVAEREGHWLLARTYAERARGYYEEFEDRANVGRLLNNLGGAELRAREHRAGRRAADGRVPGRVRGRRRARSRARALLAGQVHLGVSEAVLAEDEASRALELFGERPDYLQEIGTAQLALGRALLEQDRLIEAEEMLHAADRSFEQLSSVSHRAAAWVAQGDLAQKRDADREAARLYRRAAEALQDFRF